MGILAWLIFGGLAGWIASLLMRTDAQQGVLLNIIVGIVGAFIGGFLFALLTGRPNYFSFDIGSFAVAVIGAVVLLGAINMFRRGTIR